MTLFKIIVIIIFKMPKSDFPQISLNTSLLFRIFKSVFLLLSVK